VSAGVSTRRDLIALAGTAAAASALPLIARARPAFAQVGPELGAAHEITDVEQTAVVVYARLAKQVGGEFGAQLKKFSDYAQAHDNIFRGVVTDLGAEPPLPPKPSEIPGLEEVRKEAEAGKFAIRYANDVIQAYVDAIRSMKDRLLLKQAAQCMASSAQVLVVLRQAAGEDPVPEAFETGDAK
jgi:hypothetical protein